MNIYIKKSFDMDAIINLEGCTARYNAAEDKFSLYGKMVKYSSESNHQIDDYEVWVNFCDRNDHILYSKDTRHYGNALQMKETTFYLSLINFKNRVNLEELYYVELFILFKRSKSNKRGDGVRMMSRDEDGIKKTIR